MSTKTEQRLKEIIREHFEDVDSRINNKILDNSSGIFIWGFLMGSLFSYINFLPFLIGLLFGIVLIKKDPFMVNRIINKIFNIIVNSKNILEKKIF